MPGQCVYRNGGQPLAYIRPGCATIQCLPQPLAIDITTKRDPIDLCIGMVNDDVLDRQAWKADQGRPILEVLGDKGQASPCYDCGAVIGRCQCEHFYLGTW